MKGLIETISDLSGTSWLPWSGGDGSLIVHGAGGTAMNGTVYLQWSIDGENEFNAKDENGQDLTLTAPGVINFSIGNCYIRAYWAGGPDPVVCSIQPRGK